jgi:hypothetical protein
MKSIVSSFLKAQEAMRSSDTSLFQKRLADAMQVWIAMSFVFSFASYGISSYDWYFFAGLSVVTRRIAEAGALSEMPDTARPGGPRRFASLVSEKTNAPMAKGRVATSAPPSTHRLRK